MKSSIGTNRFTAPEPVTRAAARARQAARDTAARLPLTEGHGPVRASDLNHIRFTNLLTDGREARAARRFARRLGLARTIDDTSAWASLGALAALLRVVDDGSKRSVVVDPVGSRSTFSRWARHVGFEPLGVDVTRPEVVGRQVAAGSVDHVVRLHPHSAAPDKIDEDLTRASWALRRGGLITVTTKVGGARDGLSVADLRSLAARMDEQGLKLVGDLDLSDVQRARSAERGADGAFGLALLTFRKR
ncbi:hypothetical protein [Calidifontibacter terrae]